MNDKVDLWDNDIFEELFNGIDEDEEKLLSEKEIPTPKHVLTRRMIELQLKNEEILLFSQEDLTSGDFSNLINANHYIQDDYNVCSVKLTPINSFVLRNSMRGFKNIIEKDVAKILGEKANIIEPPHAYMTEDKKHVEVKVPNINLYREILGKVDAYPTKTGFRVTLNKVLDLESMVEKMESNMPRIVFDKEVLQLNREPILGFDGTLESLKSLPLSLLNIVAADNQTYKAKKASTETIEEKMKKMGVKNLYDLLFWLPRRYIDKSNPQDLMDLVAGETAVVVGRIDSSSEIRSGRGGAVFNIKTDNGQKIRASFFNQAWLLSKFKVNNEVLITGKFSWWNGEPQIGGASIDHAEEASLLPIVPVYKQSPSKGLTTHLIMSANRELLSRLGDVKLPVYFRQHGRMDYCEALAELHFPSSLNRHNEAVNDLAYYELVYMQLIIQEAKEKSIVKPGIKLEMSKDKLQAKAIKSLPFELTTSQKRAIVTLNKKFIDSKPSSTLLSADVGSGKTLVAQLSALKAIDAGDYQAVLIAPTDILARQLFLSFKRLLDSIETEYGHKVEIDFLSGGMKASEKKPILARIAEGTTQIIVGTHSLMSSVKYHNLGYVVIDEQQKFGAEQRSVLLNSRTDNHIPDLMMMTATPIPRSTAQVFYGDIDMVELSEKPPGRIPIETEWVREDPEAIVDELTNPMWNDLVVECKKGNQAFIITPLVSESDKIDAASAEKAYKSLSQLSLSGLNIGMVHGQMKQELQKEEMEKFKNKEYDVLIASTIVEVGVDIPDATRVVILSAERLGASSLHQIRGRVGRNSKPSKCYLVSLGRTENSQLRLQSLVDSENGFDIAKADLELRGEGKMFSADQSGRSEMIFANLSKHRENIEKAKEEALRILKSPFREKALKDSREKFESDARLM